MTQHYFSDTAIAGTLTSGMTNSQTTMLVSTISGHPSSFPYYMAVDLEVVRVTSRATTTLTVTRGVSNTTAVVHSSGAAVTHVVAAEHFNEVSAATGVWTTYTPTLVQSGTVTKTVSHARAVTLGKWTTINVDLAVTGTGTANNPVLIGIPAAAVGAQFVMGSGLIYDVSANTIYTGIAVQWTATSVALYANGSAANMGQTGGSFAAALASGDRVACCLSFELA